jgi:hypothetical protein
VKIHLDDAQVDVFTLEGEGRTSRDDVKVRDLGQRVDDLLSDSVGKVFVLLISAHVDERQHYDGIVYRALGGGWHGSGDDHGRDQSIASFGDCLNDAWIAGIVVEGAA